MKNKYLKFLFPVSLILALVLSMIGTQSVLADDATPPTPTEETPTETPPVEPLSTEEPVSTSENPDETVPEIMEQMPEDTTLVVLDENSEPLPLASNEAANILVTGDPQWCMDGHTPADDPGGGTYCTAKFSKFNGSGGLIEELTNGTGIDSGAGTIYVSHDYDASAAGDAGSDIIFNYGAIDLTDLVVQGGWDFAQNTVVGTSTIELGTGNSLEFWDWGAYGFPATLTLKDLIIQNGDGLFIGDMNDYTMADVSFDNVEVDNTEYGAYIETDGDVDITNSKFNNTNSDSGLTAYTYYGNVTLNQVWAEGNNGDGAYIGSNGDVNITNSTFKDNVYSGAYIDTCGCGVGNVFVQASAFTGNDGRGLVVYTFGNITVESIYAELNDGGGVELDNCLGLFLGGCYNTGTASVTMKGTNVIKDNGGYPLQFLSGPYASVGLWINSVGGTSIDGTSVTGNGAGDIGGGAFIFAADGDLSISNSTFDDNCTTYLCYMGFGLMAFNVSGGTTLNNITANRNGNGDGSTYNSGTAFGAVLFTEGNIFAGNSTFNENCNVGTCYGGGGIMTLTGGNVYFDHVTASNNGTSSGGGGGALIVADGNVDIYCSTFSNEGVGLEVDIPNGSQLTLNGVTFGNNTMDLVPPTSGTWVENPFNCNPTKGNGKGKPTSGLPLNLVNVGSGNGTSLDCENYSGTKLVLENGDYFIVPCPLSGSASLTKQGAEGLPSALPNGSKYLSGFESVVDGNGAVDGKLGRSALISFVIPDGVDSSSLAILFWDGSQWTEVDNTFILSENGKTYFSAYVNYTGTFVLVQR